MDGEFFKLMSKEEYWFTWNLCVHVLRIFSIKFNMKDCNLAKTPMECRLKLNREGGVEVESTHFRKLIGCLRYLTLTRPDLIFSMSYLSRFMSKLYSNHMAAARGY